MIVGVDVSSHRVDLAWLEDGRPCRWHQDLAKGHLIDRLRSIDIQWPTGGFDVKAGIWTARDDPTDIAIEYPFGRGNAIAALMATVGIITRQAPPWARVAWPSAGELRAAIGARNTKASAHAAISRQFMLRSVQVADPKQPFGVYGWDEHELDSLVACVGWTRILAAQEEM